MTAETIDQKNRSERDRVAVALAGVLELTRDFEDSQARNIIWLTFAALLLRNPIARRCLYDARFLNHDIHHIVFASGVAVYTMCPLRCEARVSFLLTRHMEHQERSVLELLQWTSHFAEHFDYTFDLSPLTSHVRGIIAVHRHPHFVVPSDALSSELELVWDIGMQEPHLVLNDTHTIATGVRVVVTPEDIHGCVPLRRQPRVIAPCSVDLRRVWTKVATGEVVSFINPTLNLSKTTPHVPIVFDTYMEVAQVLRDKYPRVKLFCRALLPSDTRDALVHFTEMEMPVVARALVIGAAHKQFGVSDDLIEAVCELVKTAGGTGPTRRAMTDSDLADVVEVGTILQADRPNAFEKIAQALSRAVEPFAWTHWLDASTALRRLVRRTATRRLCDGIKAFADLAPAVVDALLPLESAEDARRARAIAAACEAADEREVAEAAHAAAERFDAARAQRHTLSRRERQLDRRARAAAVEIVENVFRAAGRALLAQDAPTARARGRAPRAPRRLGTRMHVVDALRSRGSRLVTEWKLIGSGRFTDEDNDADVVAVVPKGHGTLASAVEAVRDELGFRSSADTVDDSHVSVLHGRIHGVHVDVQVLRADGRTEAEALTRRAVRLADLLDSHVEERGLAHLREVHGWFNAARLKGHALCRLPGVAVSTIAISLSRHTREPTLQRTLEALRERLATAAPTVALCADDYGDDANACHPARPETALQVSAERQSLATRLTIRTTRHLLDAVAYAVRHEPLDARAVATWRANAMLRVCTLALRSPSSLAKGLFSALTQLDNHPVLESVFVDDGDHQGRIDVLVTTKAARGPVQDRYGFRPDDLLSPRPDDASAVDIRRGTRTFWLQTTHRACACNTDTERRIDDSTVVPHFPTLSVDCLASFSDVYFERG